jgi:hypothetical protein
MTARITMTTTSVTPPMASAAIREGDERRHERHIDQGQAE